MKRRLIALLNEERGNVESSLVLIPLIFLFLAIFQIIIVINFKSIDHAIVQSEATQQAITGELDNEARVHRIDLYNDIRLLVIKRVRSIPQLIPGLESIVGRKPEVRMNGVAVIEEPR